LTSAWAAQERKVTDMAANSLWIVLALVLVGSSLALRRLPKGKLLAILLVWVAIFGIAWLGIRLVTGQG
jgi:hypothetical protein